MFVHTAYFSMQYVKKTLKLVHLLHALTVPSNNVQPKIKKNIMKQNRNQWEAKKRNILIHIFKFHNMRMRLWNLEFGLDNFQ